jgi:protein SCO1/2
VTGSPAQIREVAKRYGIFYRKTGRGDIDHTFLTSVIDPRGTLRVQYLGVRFELTELLNDVRSVLAEMPKR